MSSPDEKWDLVLRPQKGWWDIDFAGIWRYQDLIWLFVQRDFVTLYKQTILGPLWYVIQPIFTTGVFTIIFGQLAQIPTDGIPAFLFYMSGSISWSYFSSCLTRSSNTFIANAGVFGKVYFPRMTVPIAGVLINLAQFAIQLVLFLIVYAIFWYRGEILTPHLSLFLFPLLVLQMGLLGLGAGILISSMTTKYRDLVFALNFGLQLWMYATPIVYPASIIPSKYLGWYMINPMAPIVEGFRLGFFGKSVVTWEHMLTGWVVTLVLLLAGLLMFHRVERTFMDTV